jgi:hypothetical protein
MKWRYGILMVKSWLSTPDVIPLFKSLIVQQARLYYTGRVRSHNLISATFCFQACLPKLRGFLRPPIDPVNGYSVLPVL